jgi:hypothetical protein
MMVTIRDRAVRVRWVLVLPLMALGLGLAACGGSSSSSTTTTSATSSTPTTSGGSANQLQTFGGTIKAAKNATFKAVYTSTSSSGGTETITLEQSPPKQAFSTTDSSGTVSTLLNTGTATYACTTDQGGTPTCTSMASSGGAGALSSLIGIYNGSTALSAIQGWQTIVASHMTGVSLTFTNTTIAGQPVRCANWKYQGSSATYCVTDKGVLAKVVSTDSSGSASSSGFELTSFTTSPPASDFELPPGATVVTIPGGA